MDANEEQKQEWAARRLAARDNVLAALVAGDRTEQQVADRFGFVTGPQYISGARDLLNSLVVADLAFMKWEFGVRGSQYVPTKKGREHAAQRAVEAAVERHRSVFASAGTA